MTERYVGDAWLAPLSQWSAHYRYDATDDKLRHRIWMTALDWATALVAGTGHSLMEKYGQALLGSVGQGSCTAINWPSRVAYKDAAAYHAALSHFWEVDDAHRRSTSHPGICVLSGLMALGQAQSLSSEDVASGIVTGVEAMLRIGSFLGADHYAINHTTATAGVFGAAVSACRAARLHANQTLWAMGHAGTQAAGLWQFLDDDAVDAKAFHPAIAVRNGLTAFDMARAGITAASRILEGERAMLRAWNLAGNNQELLGPGGELMVHDITVKGWPVCGQMHSALDCADEIAQDAKLALNQIDQVTVRLPKAALKIANIRDPQSLTAAKFSSSFCIAAALLNRSPNFRNLNQTLLDDPEIRALEKKIDVNEDANFTSRFPAERPARVTVQTTSGEVLSVERSFRRGDPEAIWTREQMIARSEDVIALTDKAVDLKKLIQWCDELADGSTGWHASDLFLCFD